MIKLAIIDSSSNLSGTWDYVYNVETKELLDSEGNSTKVCLLNFLMEARPNKEIRHDDCIVSLIHKERPDIIQRPDIVDRRVIYYNRHKLGDNDSSFLIGSNLNLMVFVTHVVYSSDSMYDCRTSLITMYMQLPRMFRAI